MNEKEHERRFEKILRKLDEETEHTIIMKLIRINTQLERIADSLDYLVKSEQRG